MNQQVNIEIDAALHSDFPYRPRQLILVVRERAVSAEDPALEITAEDREDFKLFVEIFEQRVKDTAIKIGESRRGSALSDKKASSHCQEFIFAERCDKGYYNFFRRMRHRNTLSRIKAEIIMIEPNESFTAAADVWKFSDIDFDKIRNYHTPQRNPDVVVEQREDGSDWWSFHTEIVLSGMLSHDFELMEEGVRLFHQDAIPKKLIDMAVGPRMVPEEESEDEE